MVSPAKKRSFTSLATSGSSSARPVKASSIAKQLVADKCAMDKAIL